MITAILMSWKRPDNMTVIVSALQGCPRIKEILLWNNNPDVPLAFEGVTVLNSPKNFLTLPRYCLAPLARYDTIWFQDDDILIEPEQIGRLFDAYEQDPSVIYGVIGRTLDHGRYVARDVPPGPCDEVIRAQLLHWRQIQPMFSLLPTIHRDPQQVDDAEDDLYLCLARGLGRCRVVDVGPLGRHHLPGAGSPGIARWRRGDHLARRQQAVDHILSSP